MTLNKSLQLLSTTRNSVRIFVICRPRVVFLFLPPDSSKTPHTILHDQGGWADLHATPIDFSLTDCPPPS